MPPGLRAGPDAETEKAATPIAATQKATYLCDSSHAASSVKNVDAISKAFDKSFTQVFGKNWRSAKAEVLEKTKVDPRAMADIVHIAGCAAVIDVTSSCSIFYDPECSTNLGIVTAMQPKAPLRRQFEAGINSMPDSARKKAAQACTKLVAGK